MDEQIEMLSANVKSQGEDKPGMNLIDVVTSLQKSVYVSYGGSEKKGPPIKGGIEGEL